MTPGDIQSAFTGLAALAFLAALLVLVLPLDRCPHDCGHCRSIEAKAKADRRHDEYHHGYGLTRRAQDVYDCPDPKCPRNRHR